MVTLYVSSFFTRIMVPDLSFKVGGFGLSG